MKRNWKNSFLLIFQRSEINSHCELFLSLVMASYRLPQMTFDRSTQQSFSRWPYELIQEERNPWSVNPRLHYNFNNNATFKIHIFSGFADSRSMFWSLVKMLSNLMTLLIHNIPYWIGHILRRNCLFMMSLKNAWRKWKEVGRRRTQLLDDLRNRRWCWELKEDAEDQKRWKQEFINRT